MNNDSSKKRIKIILFVLQTMMFGCTATYQQNTLTLQNEKFTTERSVIIATPKDGFYADQKYPNSGKMTASAVRESFAKFAHSTLIIPECKDLECLSKSKPNILNYYVVPEILHWEDRATEWSGIPDSIEIKISIYDSKDLRDISSTVLSGKSKWATFGGDHPQDLLEEPLDNYIKTLY